MPDFICGKCVNNEDGFCDYMGLFVEDDDHPHCSYGKGWMDFKNFIKYSEDKEKGENERHG